MVKGNGEFRTASAFRKVGIEFRVRHLLREVEQQLMKSLHVHRPFGGNSQPVANEDNNSGLRSGILNKHASRELPGPIGGVDQNIPPTVDDEARLEETSSSSSEDDDHDVVETHPRRKSIEVQTNRTVTIS